MERAKARLAIVVPVTLMVIFVLMYLNFGRLAETLIVMLSIPFALIGGIWLMWFLAFKPQRRRGGRLYRPGGGGGGNRRRHADLSRQRSSSTAWSRSRTHDYRRTAPAGSSNPSSRPPRYGLS
jgi:hypothetical protein